MERTQNELYTWRKLLTEFQFLRTHVTIRFCIDIENKFLFMTLRTILSENVSRGTKKRSDEFVIGD